MNSNPPQAPVQPAKSTASGRSDAAGASAKTASKTKKNAEVKKSDDADEPDPDADVSDAALTASLPTDDSTDKDANGAKPPTKGTKDKADVVAAAPNPAATGVAPPAAQVKDVKTAVRVKGTIAKDSSTSAAKVVAADPPSSEPSAQATDPKQSSGDSLDGTDPTTPPQSTKGQAGIGKMRAGKAAQADPTAADEEVNASSAVASAAAGAVDDDPASFNDADSDSPASAAPVASIEHVTAQSVASLTAENPATLVVSNPGGTHSSTASTFVLPSGTPQLSAETQFGESNYPQIVSAVHGQLLPDGGSMQLRLDPPELGAVHINVQMRDGAMTATIEASNDQAARLLSHSLGDLKTSLESQGVNVEALHVKQSTTTPSRSSSQDSQQQQNSPTDDGNAKREQQRQQMLRRMWQRLSGGDPLDMVA